MINITDIIQEDVRNSKIKDGIAVIFVPHTTAGITINENADPDVVYDMLSTLRNVFPNDAVTDTWKEIHMLISKLLLWDLLVQS